MTVVLASSVANGRPHVIAALEQLDDAPAGQIAGPARDQDGLVVSLGHRAYSITPIARAGAARSIERPGFAKSTWTSRRRRSRNPASLIASHRVQSLRKGSS